MFLSDHTIEQLTLFNQLITPYTEAQIQPASYDVLLGHRFLVPYPQGWPPINSSSTPWELVEYDAHWDALRSRLYHFNNRHSEVHGMVDLDHLPPTDKLYRIEQIPENGYFLLRSGAFVLGTTQEVVKIPNNVRCSIEGKSSLARLGTAPHIAAGYVDPGFHGKVTLELVNLGPWDLVLRPGRRIAQLAFAFLDRECRRPYGSPGLGSHYQGQTDVQGSRYSV